MSRNGPNQLQTIEKAWKGLLDGFQIAATDVLELALESGEKLDEVLGLSVQFGELLLLLLEVGTLVAFTITFQIKNLKNLNKAAVS